MCFFSISFVVSFFNDSVIDSHLEPVSLVHFNSSSIAKKKLELEICTMSNSKLQLFSVSHVISASEQKEYNFDSLNDENVDEVFDLVDNFLSVSSSGSIVIVVSSDSLY